MANEAQKRSNFVGLDRTNMTQYVFDLDKDIRNLFIEKTINLRASKRYTYTIAATYSA